MRKAFPRKVPDISVTLFFKFFFAVALTRVGVGVGVVVWALGVEPHPLKGRSGREKGQEG